MNIVFLDAKTIGEDIDLSGYDRLGTVGHSGRRERKIHIGSPANA